MRPRIVALRHLPPIRLVTSSLRTRACEARVILNYIRTNGAERPNPDVVPRGPCRCHCSRLWSRLTSGARRSLGGESVCLPGEGEGPGCPAATHGGSTAASAGWRRHGRQGKRWAPRLCTVPPFLPGRNGPKPNPTTTSPVPGTPSGLEARRGGVGSGELGHAQRQLRPTRDRCHP